MTDRRLNNVMVQYFPTGTAISASSLGSTFLTVPVPRIVSRGDIDALVTTAVTSTPLQGADFGSTVINLMLPEGTVLTTDEAPSDASASGAASQVKPYATPSAKFSLGREKATVRETVDSMNGVGGYLARCMTEREPSIFPWVCSRRAPTASMRSGPQGRTSWRLFITNFAKFVPIPMWRMPIETMTSAFSAGIRLRERNVVISRSSKIRA